MLAYYAEIDVRDLVQRLPVKQRTLRTAGFYRRCASSHFRNELVRLHQNPGQRDSGTTPILARAPELASSTSTTSTNLQDHVPKIYFQVCRCGQDSSRMSDGMTKDVQHHFTLPEPSSTRRLHGLPCRRRLRARLAVIDCNIFFQDVIATSSSMSCKTDEISFFAKCNTWTMVR